MNTLGFHDECDQKILGIIDVMYVMQNIFYEILKNRLVMIKKV